MSEKDQGSTFWTENQPRDEHVVVSDDDSDVLDNFELTDSTSIKARCSCGNMWEKKHSYFGHKRSDCDGLVKVYVMPDETENKNIEVEEALQKTQTSDDSGHHPVSSDGGRQEESEKAEEDSIDEPEQAQAVSSNAGEEESAAHSLSDSTVEEIVDERGVTQSIHPLLSSVLEVVDADYSDVINMFISDMNKDQRLELVGKLAENEEIDPDVFRQVSQQITSI